jgi:hypothetical protein
LKLPVTPDLKERLTPKKMIAAKLPMDSLSQPSPPAFSWLTDEQRGATMEAALRSKRELPESSARPFGLRKSISL